MTNRLKFGFATLAVAAVAGAALLLEGCGSPGGSGDGQTASTTATELSGLGRSQVVALLGPADFNRVDGPAEILQYRNGRCILDVFLYTKAAGGETRVTHVEARNGNMETVSGESCLDSVVQSPRPRTG